MPFCGPCTGVDFKTDNYPTVYPKITSKKGTKEKIIKASILSFSVCFLEMAHI